MKVSYLLQHLLGRAEEQLASQLHAQDLVPVHLQQAALRGWPHEAAPLVDPLQSVSIVPPKQQRASKQEDGVR